MKQKGERKDKKEKFLSSVRLFLLLLTFLISFASSTYGQEAPVPDAGTAPEAGYTGIDYTETFTAGHETDWLLNENNFGNPAFVDNAQQYLGGLDGFSGDDYNIAQEYITRVPDFTDPQAQDIGNTFFSGDSSQVRSFLSSSTEKVQKAQEFFRAKFDKEFNLAGYHADFQYHADGRVTNGGKTISPEQLAGITGIKAVADGFCMTAADGRDNCMGGGLAGSVSYDERSRSFSMVSETDETQRYSFTPAEVREREEPAEVQFQVENDGSVRIEGPGRANIRTSLGEYKINNRRGIANIRGDGSFTIENAELITPNFFIDGSAEYNVAAKQLVLRNHGDQSLGNMRDGVTVAIYNRWSGREGKNIGFSPVGDGKVTINFDAMVPDAQLSPGEPPSPEAVRDMAREYISALPLQRRTSYGKDAVVSVAIDGNELLVHGNGPFETALYQDKALVTSSPLYYLGIQGRETDPEFDLRINGERRINMRGKGILIDEQHGSLSFAISEDGTPQRDLQVRSGFENYQDSSSLAVTDNTAGYTVSVACYGCSAGQRSSTMRKNIIFGEAATEALGERGMFRKLESADLAMNFVVNNEGILTMQIPANELQRVVGKAGNMAILGKSPDIVLQTDLGEGQGMKQVFRFGRPTHHQQTVERSSIALYGETFNIEGEQQTKIGNPISYDFGVKEYTGERLLVVSDANAPKVDALLSALQEGREIPTLEFEEDPRLRQALLLEGIDVALLSDSTYRNNIQQAAEKRRNIEVIAERFRSRYAELFGAPSGELTFNERGICVRPPECQQNLLRAARGGYALSYDASLLAIRSLEAENLELEMQQRSNEHDGKRDAALTQQQRENRRQIQKMHGSRGEIMPPSAPGAPRAEERYADDIREGRNTEDFNDDRQRAVNNGIAVRRADPVLDELNDELEKVNNVLREVDRKIQELGPITAIEQKIQRERGEFSGIRGQRERERQSLLELHRQIHGRIDEAQDIQAIAQWEVIEDAEKHSREGRPDQAAALLAYINFYQEAEQEAQKLGQTAPDRANAIRADLRLRESGYNPEKRNLIAEAVQFQGQIEDSELKRSLERGIHQAVIAHLGRDVTDTSREGYRGGYERHDGESGIMGGLRASALRTMDYMARFLLTPAEELGEPGFEGAGIRGLVENPRTWDVGYQDELRDDFISLGTDAREAEAQLRASQASVDNPENFKRILRQWSADACERNSANCAALSYYAGQVNGEQLSPQEQREQEAREELAAIQRQRRVSGSTPSFAELERIERSFAGTSAAQEARQQRIAMERPAEGQVLAQAAREIFGEEAAEAISVPSYIADDYGEVAAELVADPLNIAMSARAGIAVKRLYTAATARQAARAQVAERVARVIASHSGTEAQAARGAMLVAAVAAKNAGRAFSESVARQGMIDAVPSPVAAAGAERARTVAHVPEHQSMFTLALRRTEQDADALRSLRTQHADTLKAGDSAAAERLGWDIDALETRNLARQKNANALLVERGEAIRRAEPDVLLKVDEIDRRLVREVIDPPSEPLADDVLRRMQEDGVLPERASQHIAAHRAQVRKPENLLEAVEEQKLGIRQKGEERLRAEELPPSRQIGGVLSAAGEIVDGRVVRRVIDDQAARISSLEQRVASLPVDDLNDVGRALDDLETVRLRIPETQRPQVRVGCSSPCAVQVLDNAGQEIPFEQLPARFGAAGEELQQQVRKVDSVMDEVAGMRPQLSGVETRVDELAEAVESTVRQKALPEAAPAAVSKTEVKYVGAYDRLRANAQGKLPFDPEDLPEALILQRQDGTLAVYLSPEDYETFLSLQRKKINPLWRWTQSRERIAARYPGVLQRDEFLAARLGEIPPGHDLDSIVVALEQGEIRTLADLQPRAIETHTVNGVAYKYNPATSSWTAGDQPIRELETLMALESRRIGVPRALIEGSMEPLTSLATLDEGGRLLLTPQALEQKIFRTVDSVGDGRSLTKEKIKELVLLRARQEGFSPEELRALDEGFEKLYLQSQSAVSEVPVFSNILAEKDPSFVNVHLFRDGSLLGASDIHYRKLTGAPGESRIIYVSRDTSPELNKVGEMMEAAGQSSKSFPEFRAQFQRLFNERMHTDAAFRQQVEQIYAYLQQQGLIGKKLRFVDTCCKGSVNYFLEGIVRFNNPDAELQSVLMVSDIPYLSAGLSRGGAVEVLSQPVRYAKKFDEAGNPLMEFHSSGSRVMGVIGETTNPFGPRRDQVLSYLDTLVTLQSTTRRVEATVGIKPGLLLGARAAEEVSEAAAPAVRFSPGVRAKRLRENAFELDGAHYAYDSNLRVWDRITPGEEIQPSVWGHVDGLDDLAELEAARLDMPYPVVDRALQDRLIIYRQLPDPSNPLTQAVTIIPPQRLEERMAEVARSFAASPTPLNKDSIKELVLLRAKAEGLTAEHLRNIEQDFDQLYDGAASDLGDIPHFIHILDQMDPEYTNVHFLRDGLFIGQADNYYRQLRGRPGDVKAIYVSRDTLGKQSDKLRDMLYVNAQIGSIPEFNRVFHQEFTRLMDSDPEFRAAADKLYAYLQKEGLLQEEAKLRFIDTCCTGTINYMVEGVIRYYNPSIQTESVLMESSIPLLNAGLRGGRVERAFMPLRYAGADAQGQPLLKLMSSGQYIGNSEKKFVSNPYGPQAEQVLFYLEELVLMEKTGKRAEKAAGWGVHSPQEISRISPRDAAQGAQSSLAQEALQFFKPMGEFSDDVISTHPIKIYQHPTLPIKVLVKEGPSHTTRADLIGQRFFALMGLPVPETEIVRSESGLQQVMEFIEDASSSQAMPAAFHSDETVQAGFVVDAFLGNYDRTPWNFLYGNDGAYFIDQGASLTSRTRGGYKGFQEEVTADEIGIILTNPQFGGEVNPAYANLVEVENGQVLVKNPEVLRESVGRLKAVTYGQIDAIVDHAFSTTTSVYDPSSMEFSTKKEIVERIAELQKQLSISDDPRTSGALETATRILHEFDGNEAEYLKYALKKRRDSLTALLDGALQQTETLPIRERAAPLVNDELIDVGQCGMCSVAAGGAIVGLACTC